MLAFYFVFYLLRFILFFASCLRFILFFASCLRFILFIYVACHATFDTRGVCVLPSFPSFLSLSPPRTILSVHLPRILCGFSFLVVLPDVIRLTSVPAPHCPVPASSASGLLSLFSPPCPVRATSAGAFSIATCGAISLFCWCYFLILFFTSCSRFISFFTSCLRFFCCLPPVCVFILFIYVACHATFDTRGVCVLPSFPFPSIISVHFSRIIARALSLFHSFTLSLFPLSPFRGLGGLPSPSCRLSDSRCRRSPLGALRRRSLLLSFRCAIFALASADKSSPRPLRAQLCLLIRDSIPSRFIF